jgi:intracellular multiplication protein IcmL
MQNQPAAVSRRLSDPDFQASLVNRCIGLAICMAVLLGMSLTHDAYVWMNPPQGTFFRIDGRTPPQPLVPLSSPIVDDTELLQWSVKAVLAPYSVNYHDYPEQLNAAGRRFTPNGWNTFAEEFKRTGNLEAMKRARLLCYAQAQRAALIRETKVINGRLAYDVQFPIVQTCQNTQQESTTRLMVTALVVRTDIQNNPDGLAIEQLVADQM